MKTHGIHSLAIGLVATCLLAAPRGTSPEAALPDTVPAAGANIQGCGTEDRLSADVEAIIAQEYPGCGRAARRSLAAAIVHESLGAGIDPVFTAALITMESAFRTDTVSPKGAVGLMQVKPSTAAALHPLMTEGSAEGDLTDPVVNLRLGIRYLLQLRERFGDWKHALAAYHMGPDRIASRQRAGGRVPEWYWRLVFARYATYKGIGSRAAALKSPAERNAPSARRSSPEDGPC